MSNLGSLPSPVRKADMQPPSWGQLSVRTSQDSLVAVRQGRVTPVVDDDAQVRPASSNLPLSSVVALGRRRGAFTRYHPLLCDCFTCQHCGGELPAPALPFDHIAPPCRGGQTSWDFEGRQGGAT